MRESIQADTFLKYCKPMSGKHTCQNELENSSLSVRLEQYLGTKSCTDKEFFEATNGIFRLFNKDDKKMNKN